MVKMDEEKVKSIIEEGRDNYEVVFCLDCEKYFYEPLMEAFGDDVEEILSYLDKLDEETLDFISGCFEYIYGKFMTDEVWNALEKLEEKIAGAKENNE